MSKLFKLFTGRRLTLGGAKASTLGQPVGLIAEENGFYA